MTLRHAKDVSFELYLKIPKKQGQWIVDVHLIASLDGDVPTTPSPWFGRDVLDAARELIAEFGSSTQFVLEHAWVGRQQFVLFCDCSEGDDSVPQYVARLLQLWIRKFDPTRVEGFTWSMGAIGGAYVVTAKRVKTLNTVIWMAEALAKARWAEVKRKPEPKVNPKADVITQPTP